MGKTLYCNQGTIPYFPLLLAQAWYMIGTNISGQTNDLTNTYANENSYPGGKDIKR